MEILMLVCSWLFSFADWAMPSSADDADKLLLLTILVGGVVIWTGGIIVGNFHKVVERLALYRAARRLSLRPKQQALFLAGVYRR